MGSPSDITLPLDEWRNGRDDAFDELFAAYGELRSLARELEGGGDGR